MRGRIGAMGRIPRLPITWTAPLAILLMARKPVQAFELSGGLSFGGFQAGAIPRLAVTPHAGISWRRESGFLFAVNDLFNILAPINKAGMGVYNKTSITVGMAGRMSTSALAPRFRSTPCQRAAPRYYVGALSG